ncbi:MAG: RHS repeat-associated core domain-containing protein [Bacteroidota bacterium]
MVRSSYIFLFTFLIGTFGYGQNITRPNIQGPSGMEINSFTGNLFFQRIDLFLPGPGMPIDLNFSYNSYRDTLDWGYGAGWTFSYHYRYYPDTAGSQDLIVERPDGRRDLYTFNGSGFDSPAGIFDTWTETAPGEYVLESKFGMEMYFEDPSHQRITRMREPNGNELIFTYTGEALSQISHSSGRSVNLNWQNGRLFQIVDANVTPQRQWLFIYEQDSLLRFAVNPEFKAIEYVYNSNGLITNMIDRNGDPTYIVYDGSDRVKRIKSCDAELSVTYAASQGKTFVVERGSAGEHITRYSFDAEGNVLEKQGNCCGFNTNYGYDSELNVNTLVDGNGNQTNYGYDSEGNVLALVDPLGASRSFAYEPTFNNLTQLTDKNGNSTSFTYDGQGNLTQINRPLGISEQYAYNGNGQVSGYTDGNSQTTSFGYNATGDLTQITYPIGNESFTYDGAGNLTGMTNPNGFNMTMEYDVLDRLTRIVDPLGHDQFFTYDAEDNLTKVVDENGYGTEYIYDGLDRLIGVDDSAGITVYEYDGVGNLTQMTDANGHISTFSYNGDNLLVEESDPEGNTVQYTYDSNRNLIQKIDPNGQVTTYTYDALNRLTGRSYPGNSETFVYDAEGNLTSATNNDVTMLFTYDALNRLTSKTLSNWGKSISYTYDDADNRTSMTDPDGGVTQYQYDGNNRLTQLTDPSGNTTAFTYDAAGRMTQQTNGNGTYVQYYYDDADRVDSIVHREASGNVLLRYSYTYDARGNRLSMTDLNGTHSYSYDGSYRLDSVRYPNGDTEYFMYDGTGNRTQLVENGIGTQYTYDAADRLEAAGSASFTFDNNGNMTSRDDSTGLTTFSYDGQDRLLQVTLPSGATVSYTYDPFGNRLTRTDTSGQVVRYFLDGANPLMEMNPGGQTLARYTSGLTMDSWLSMRRGGQTYYYHQDALGSVKALTDGGQTVASLYDYAAFGSLKAQTGNVMNPYTYTGREWDAQAGIYYYRTRYYDAEVGRFVGKDRFRGFIDEPKSRNFYTYTSNNPLSYIDPDGRYFFLVPVIKAAAVAFLSSVAINTVSDIGDQIKNSKSLEDEIDCGSAIVSGIETTIKEDLFGFDPSKKIKKGKKAIQEAIDLIRKRQGKAAAKKAAEGGLDYAEGKLEDGIYNETYGKVSEAAKNQFGFNCNPFSKGFQDKVKNLTNNVAEWLIETIAAFDPNEIIIQRQKDLHDLCRCCREVGIIFKKDGIVEGIVYRNPLGRVKTCRTNDLNPLSLNIQDFGFGDFNFTVPSGQGFYQTRLDDQALIDSLGVIVDMTAGLDFSNNRAFWRFEALDPNTLLPPTDATLGFLPVNDTITRAGEGYVRFTIVPNPAAQTGDTIYEQAEIIFDDNPSIFTNTHFNTIDALPPTLELAPVAGLVQDSFELNITFLDDSAASGTDSYDLFLSVDGQPIITLALGITQDTLIRFEGQQNKAHCVYALARDNVVNIQPYTTTPLACFLVRDTAFVNPTFPNGGEQFCVGDTIRITWEKRNVEQVNIAYSLDNGMTFLPLADSIPAGDTSFLWYIPPTFPVSNDVLVQAIATLEDTIIGRSDSVFSIGRTDAPPLTVTDTAICAGDTLNIGATQAYASYLWSNGANTPSISSDTSGSFFLQVVGFNGCVSPLSDTVDLVVNPLPAQPTIVASSALTFCTDDSVSLSGPAGFAYLWSSGDTTQTITVDTIGSFTLTVIDSNGCESSLSSAVSTTVNPLPVQPIISASGPLQFCEGGTVQLSGPTNFAYQWNSGSNTQTITVDSSGSFHLVVIDTNSCASPASLPINVQVDTLPVQPIIDVPNNGIICSGDTLTLSGPTGLTSYLWSNGATTPSIQVDTVGNFSLIVFDSNNCESPVSDTIHTTIRPLPLAPSISINGPSELCTGDSVMISTTALGTYLWNTGDTTQSIVASQSGQYFLSVGDSLGCVSPTSDSVLVTVNPLPAQPSIIPLDTVICEGEIVELTVVGEGSVLWSNGDTLSSILVDSTSSWTVTVTDSLGCISTASTVAEVNVRTVPDQPSIIIQPNDTLFANVAADFYEWYIDGVLLPDSTQSIEALQSGSYRVIAFNGPCASDTSGGVDVIVTNITKAFAGGVITIFPNPNSGVFLIDGVLPGITKVKVSIFDQRGRKIQNYQLRTLDGVFREKIDLRPQPIGTYVVRLEAKGEEFVQRVVIIP